MTPCATIPVAVTFWSYFKDLAGCGSTTVEVPRGATLGQVIDEVMRRFPGLTGLRQSALVAVGVDYQRPDYCLREGDEVSLFPPVQGG